MKLSVYKNDQLVSEVELDEETKLDQHIRPEYFVGRASDCQIILDHPQVSRLHGLIKKTGTTWEISKAPGLGQLLVNGVPVERRELANGDVITITPFIINVSHIPSSAQVQDFLPPKREEIPAVEPLMASSSAPAVEPAAAADDFLAEEGEGGPSDPQGQEEGLEVSATDNTEEIKEGFEQKDEFGGSDPFGGGDEEHKKDEFSSGSADSSEGSGDFSSGGETSAGEMAQVDYAGDGGDEGADDGKTRAFVSFAQYNLKIFGEFAPYDTYSVKDGETFIGRDKQKCQIVLDDPEVSSVHAVLRKSKINLMLEDLDSSNGTILNGSRINQAEISKNDEFIIGSTTFTVLVQSDLLQAEDGRLMPVEENQEVVVEEVVEEEVDFDASGSLEGAVLGEDLGKTQSSALFSKGSLKDPAKRKKILYMVVGLLVVMLLLEEEEPKKVEEKKDKSAKDYALKKEEGEGKDKDDKDDPKKQAKKKILTPEEKEYLESAYQLAKTYFDQGKYKEAEFEINKIFEVSPDGYKEASQIRTLISEAYKLIMAEKEKEQREVAEKLRKKQVDELVVKAREATNEKKVELAEGLFVKILELDPEQADVSLMKMELDAWKKEKERKELEKVQKEAERNRKVSALTPGKTFYLKKKWFNAIGRLEEFLKIPDMDEDLIKEATSMLDESKKNLNKAIAPLLGKARSLREGQDFKGAYENYLKVLKLDPSNAESLNEMTVIRETLDTRLRKIYREAIIAESLSLFSDAKEKFQEVQQISPTDSEYYRKATDKLKDYVE